jgi:hypothetical protein
VTFKTHESYLSTLLPTNEFEIATQGGWTTASFSVWRLGNLDWLGGRDYSFFGLYIHDVAFTESTVAASDAADSKPAEQLKGDFLPALLETTADPIITGREELGFAKVLATIEKPPSSPTPSSSYTLSAGREGTEFLRLSLSGLTQAPEAESALQTPPLHYKVIP